MRVVKLIKNFSNLSVNTPLLLIVCLGVTSLFNIYVVEGNSPIAIYSVVWSDEIRSGSNMTYEISYVSSKNDFLFEKGQYLIVNIGKLPEQVESGFHSNFVSKFYYKNQEISKNIIAPILVPRKVFRVCCNAYKPLIYQLKDWGWENFTNLYENEQFFDLTYENIEITSRIRYNYDGVALLFNISLNEFKFSAKFINIIPNSSKISTFSSTIFIEYISLFLPLLILVIYRGRQK